MNMDESGQQICSFETYTKRDHIVVKGCPEFLTKINGLLLVSFQIQFYPLRHGSMVVLLLSVVFVKSSSRMLNYLMLDPAFTYMPTFDAQNDRDYQLFDAAPRRAWSLRTNTFHSFTDNPSKQTTKTYKRTKEFIYTEEVMLNAGCSRWWQSAYIKVVVDGGSLLTLRL